MRFFKSTPISTILINESIFFEKKFIDATPLALGAIIHRFRHEPSPEEDAIYLLRGAVTALGRTLDPFARVMHNWIH